MFAMKFLYFAEVEGLELIPIMEASRGLCMFKYSHDWCDLPPLDSNDSNNVSSSRACLTYRQLGICDPGLRNIYGVYQPCAFSMEH
jgi:hypothetical protein